MFHTENLQVYYFTTVLIYYVEVLGTQVLVLILKFQEF